jgi:hypothetical protein
MEKEVTEAKEVVSIPFKTGNISKHKLFFFAYLKVSA